MALPAPLGLRNGAGRDPVITADDFREVMRNLAAGVTIVTTEVDGEYFGTTVTSFSSVSLEPMLIQIALDTESRIHAAVKDSGKFAANILSVEQERLARRCADSMAVDRFRGVDVTLGEAGVPLIDGSIAALECRVTAEFPAGDHTVFIGEVVAAHTGDGAPLLYYQGDYGRIDEERWEKR